MGMQSFIKKEISTREEKRKLEIANHGKDTCPNCYRNRREWIRNIFGTLECMCGKKFYIE